MTASRLKRRLDTVESRATGFPPLDFEIVFVSPTGQPNRTYRLIDGRLDTHGDLKHESIDQAQGR